MSDPYVPPTSPNQAPGADRYGNPTRPGSPNVTVSQTGGSGLGTGAIVGIVFVIVAILAAVFLYPRDAADTTSPGVTIETEGGDAAVPATPDAGAADPAAPEAVPDAAVPEAVAPDGATPDATVPDASTPDAAAPDATAPDAAAPDAEEPATPPAP